jgi:transposase
MHPEAHLLDKEDNVEVLRGISKIMLDHITKLEKELHVLRDRAEKQKQLDLGIKIELTNLKKLIFGRKSDKRLEANDRPRNKSNDDLLLHSQSLFPEIKDVQIAKLAEQVIIYSATDDELVNESKLRGLDKPSFCQWEEINGLYDKSTEITVIERQYKKVLHQRKKYRLKKEFNQSDKEVIVTATGAEKLLPGSTYSIDFAVGVVADKYISHTPLERQTREMHSLGLKSMKTKTLSNLCQTVAIYGEPVTNKILQEVLNHNGVVHADETPWKIQIKEQDDGYMWVISNQVGSYYVFEPTRSGHVIQDLLNKFKGVVICDGYVGYNRLKGKVDIDLAHCWAHVRRKYTDIEKNYPTECKEVLDLIDELFRIEREAKTFDQLKQLRKDRSKLLIEILRIKLNELLPNARSESYLKNAIEYNLKYWDGLIKFLKNENIPLTNNEAERTIRHAVMGRKNFYGSRNHNGADTTAILYTLIESCKRLEVDPRTYINMMIRKSVHGEQPPTPLEYAKSLRQ